MRVWLVEEEAYESGRFVGVYATEELATEILARNTGTVMWDEEVITELPPAPPGKPRYQVIP